MFAVSEDFAALKRQEEDLRIEREAREASLSAKVVAAYAMSLVNAHADLEPHRAEIERAHARLGNVLKRMNEGLPA